MRSFTAVLLRRYVVKLNRETPARSLLEAAGEECVKSIQALMLQALANESDPSVRSKVADSAAQVAQLLLMNKCNHTSLNYQLIGRTCFKVV